MCVTICQLLEENAFVVGDSHPKGLWCRFRSAGDKVAMWLQQGFLQQTRVTQKGLLWMWGVYEKLDVIKVGVVHWFQWVVDNRCRGQQNEGMWLSELWILWEWEMHKLGWCFARDMVGAKMRYGKVRPRKKVQCVTEQNVKWQRQYPNFRKPMMIITSFLLCDAHTLDGHTSASVTATIGGTGRRDTSSPLCPSCAMGLSVNKT